MMAAAEFLLGRDLLLSEEPWLRGLLCSTEEDCLARTRLLPKASRSSDLRNQASPAALSTSRGTSTPAATAPASTVPPRIVGLGLEEGTLRRPAEGLAELEGEEP